MGRYYRFFFVHRFHPLSIPFLLPPVHSRARSPSISGTPRCARYMIFEMYDKGNISTLVAKLRSGENNYVGNLSRKQLLHRTGITGIGYIPCRYHLACHHSGSSLVMALRNFRVLRANLPNHPTFRSTAFGGTKSRLSLCVIGGSIVVRG
jgi:hypothetical protein